MVKTQHPLQLYLDCRTVKLWSNGSWIVEDMALQLFLGEQTTCFSESKISLWKSVFVTKAMYTHSVQDVCVVWLYFTEKGNNSVKSSNKYSVNAAIKILLNNYMEKVKYCSESSRASVYFHVCKSYINAMLAVHSCSLRAVIVPVFQNDHIWKHWGPTSGSEDHLETCLSNGATVICCEHMAALPCTDQPVCFTNQSALCYYSYAHNICTYSSKLCSGSVLLSLPKLCRETRSALHYWLFLDVHPT